jgi:hypothetical protein
MDRQARPGSGDAGVPTDELGRRIAALIGLARDMGALLSGVEEHGLRAVTLLAQKQIELERAVARILEAEKAIHDWLDRTGGTRGGAGPQGDIDFDAVRYEIGCRLSRLRECCGPD